MDFGKLIKDARQRAGLSQEELAKQMGTSQTVVSRYERGDQIPGADMLQRIASALDCELVIEFRPKGQA